MYGTVGIAVWTPDVARVFNEIVMSLSKDICVGITRRNRSSRWEMIIAAFICERIFH